MAFSQPLGIYGLWNPHGHAVTCCWIKESLLPRRLPNAGEHPHALISGAWDSMEVSAFIWKRKWIKTPLPSLWYFGGKIAKQVLAIKISWELRKAEGKWKPLGITIENVRMWRKRRTCIRILGHVALITQPIYLQCLVICHDKSKYRHTADWNRPEEGQWNEARFGKTA